MTPAVSLPRKFDSALTWLASVCVIFFPFLIFLGSAACEIAMSTTAIAFALHSARTRDWKWLREPWFICLIILWGYMMVRGLFAQNPHEALHRSLPFIRYPVYAAALSFWVMRNMQVRRRFLLALTLSMSFTMLDGFLQWKTGYDIFGRTSLPDSLGHIRLTGPFGQTKPIMGIMLVWFSFPVCLHMLMTQQGRFAAGKKLLGGLAFSLAMLCMVALSGERMALMLALLGWFIVALLTRLRLRNILSMALAAVITLGCIAVAVPDMFERQIKTTLTTFAHWQESPYGKIMASDMQLAAIDPVFGLGANHFRIACPDLYPNADKDFLAGVCNIHPHNIYFEWLIENGVIGLGLFIAFLLLLAARCRADWPLLRLQPVFIGWCVAFAVRIWPIGSTTGFFSNWGAPPFWLVVGMLLAYSATAARNDDDHTALPV